MSNPITQRPIHDRRLIITIFYKSAWESFSHFCYGLRKDNTLRWAIPDNPAGWRRLLAAVGDWAERRDHAWVERYAFSGTRPPKRRRRK